MIPLTKYYDDQTKKDKTGRGDVMCVQGFGRKT
jgi:hypothetical protein